ncbi:MAG: HEAT repeat domain-containing protein, partial [Planctomycetes bacterium]|nr:HEAT repeat domain-containing protein [Planctomycetota bacterium]
SGRQPVAAGPAGATTSGRQRAMVAATARGGATPWRRSQVAASLAALVLAALALVYALGGTGPDEGGPGTGAPPDDRVPLVPTAPSEEELRSAMEALRSPDATVRLEAIRRLGRVAGEPALQPLEGLLTHPDRDTRGAAAFALRDIRTRLERERQRAGGAGPP